MFHATGARVSCPARKVIKMRDFIVVTLGRLSVIITLIISVRVITTMLTPLEVGRLNIITAICGWFGLVLLNPVGMYVNRKLVEWYREKTTKTYLIYLAKYILIVAVVSVGMMLLLRPLIGINITYLWLAALVAGSIVFNSGNQAYTSYINLLGHRFPFVLISNLTLWVGIIFSLFLVKRFSPAAEYWLSGQLLGQFALLLLAGVVLSRILSNAGDSVTIKDNTFSAPLVFKYAWPLALDTFLYWVHMQGYRFIFQRAAGVETLGLFVVGFGIGSNLMVSFDALFNQYYHPIFYKDISNSDARQRITAWNKYASIFFPSLILVMGYIALNGNLLARIFTGARFHQIGNIIIWGALAEGLRMMASTTALVSHAQMETKPLILPRITGTVTAVIGMLLLGFYRPLIGFGISISAGCLLGLVHLYISMKRLLPIQFPWKRIIYSLVLGSPLLVFFIVVNRNINNPTIMQSFLLLVIPGTYLLFIQYILVRKWFPLFSNLSVVDNIEDKLRLYFDKIINP